MKNSKKNITLIILLAFVFTDVLHSNEDNKLEEKVLPYWVETELSPVNSRPGSRWMNLWLQLEHDWKGWDVAKHWFASLIEDSKKALTALVIISREDDRAVLHIAKIRYNPGEDKPDKELPVEYMSCIIGTDLAIKINSVSLKELLKVKYTTNTGKTIMMGGTRIILGADSIDQPYTYFLGKCTLTELSPLKWIEDITAELLMYVKATGEEKTGIEKRINDILRNREKTLE